MRHAQTISVVITTYNRPDALAAVVRACFMQNDKNFEIIIADDGSTANTRDLRATAWQRTRRCRCATSGSPTRASARRWRATAAPWPRSGEYIVFLDGDCIPQRDFIARHRALSEPGCLVSGSRILMSERLTRRVLDEGIDDRRPPASPRAWPGACAAT